MQYTRQVIAILGLTLIMLSACRAEPIAIPSMPPVVLIAPVTSTNLSIVSPSPTPSYTWTPTTTPTAQPSMTATTTRTRQPTPTATLSPITPLEIADPGVAIKYSQALLEVQRGYKGGVGFLGGEAVQVQFPNGEPGELVALSFAAPYHGFEILYRIRNDQVEVVDIVMRVSALGKISFLELFPGRDGKMERIIKVEGACCSGTGTGGGVFELQRVTDKGLRTVFQGVNGFYSYQPWSNKTWNYKYTYQDWDGDGVKEIFGDGEICNWRWDAAGRSYIKDVCTSEHVIYALTSEFSNRENIWYSHDPLPSFGPSPYQRPLGTPAP